MSKRLRHILFFFVVFTFSSGPVLTIFKNNTIQEKWSTITTVFLMIALSGLAFYVHYCALEEIPIFKRQRNRSVGKKAEKWAVVLGWWIPRKYRDAIVGDILEDCKEMREVGCGEWRIRIQVIWQWAIAAVTLVPSAIISTVWRIVSPPQ